jgi:hypothetical protein
MRVLPGVAIGRQRALDVHHARDPLWALAHTLHGEDIPEAKAWGQPRLRSLRTGKEAHVVRVKNHDDALLWNQELP